VFSTKFVSVVDLALCRRPHPLSSTAPSVARLTRLASCFAAYACAADVALHGPSRLNPADLDLSRPALVCVARRVLTLSGPILGVVRLEFALPAILPVVYAVAP
jgi:hypothetical protein